jgi:hypothetical protein
MRVACVPSFECKPDVRSPSCPAQILTGGILVDCTQMLLHMMGAVI